MDSFKKKMMFKAILIWKRIKFLSIRRIEDLTDNAACWLMIPIRAKNCDLFVVTTLSLYNNGKIKSNII